jgi:hypothetical protein
MRSYVCKPAGSGKPWIDAKRSRRRLSTTARQCLSKGIDCGGRCDISASAVAVVEKARSIGESRGGDGIDCGRGDRVSEAALALIHC